MSEKPKLQLIQGGASKASAWLDCPKVILGRSPFDKNRYVSYRISKEHAHKSALSGRREPMFDLWANVFGKPPPIPGIEQYEDYKHLLSNNSFPRAYACFRGVRRPVGEDDRGTDVCAFVSKPKIRYISQISMACLAKPVEVPTDVLMVTHVKLDFPIGRAYQSAIDGPQFNGVVTKWEFVECDSENTSLPIGHKERFWKQCW